MLGDVIGLALVDAAALHDKGQAHLAVALLVLGDDLVGLGVTELHAFHAGAVEQDELPFLVLARVHGTVGDGDTGREDQTHVKNQGAGEESNSQ